MKCPNCRTAVAGDTRFCPECGATVGGGGGQRQQGSETHDEGQVQGGQRAGGGEGPSPEPGREPRGNPDRGPAPDANPGHSGGAQPGADARPGRQGPGQGHGGRAKQGPGQPGAGSQPDQPAGESPPGGPPAGQPQQGPPPEQPQQGPPPGGSGGGQSGGVSRRALLAGGVGVLAAAGVGGWYLFLREAGPVAVARQSWEAWTAGDFEAYEQVVHADSPLRDRWPQDIGENFGPPEGAELTMESRELVEQGETEATVKEVYVWNPPDGSADRVTDVLRLRTEAGAWRLWDLQNADAEPVNG